MIIIVVVVVVVVVLLLLLLIIMNIILLIIVILIVIILIVIVIMAGAQGPRDSRGGLRAELHAPRHGGRSEGGMIVSDMTVMILLLITI